MALSPLNKTRIYWLIMAWGIICTLLLLQLVITEGLRPELFTTERIVAIPLVRLLVGVGLILLLVLPAYRWLGGQSIWIKALGFTGAGLIFSLVYVGLGTFILQRMQGAVQREDYLIAVIEDYLSNLHHIITYYLMFLAVMLAIDYFRDKLEAVRTRQHLEQQLAETRLQVLKNQLQPHFLFNALNSVTSILAYKPEVAQDMLVDISTLLRTSLRIDYGRLIPLERELEILQTYLDIEKRRFEHQLDVRVAIAPTAKGELVPPFILQPLVENAIKHGYREGIGQLCIRIDITKEKELIGIRIANNGARLVSPKVQVGLSSVQQRLENAYGDRGKVTLRQEQDWVVNQIEIKMI